LIRIITVLSFILISVYACAPKVTTSVVMPANDSLASGIKTVAVLPFSGNYGGKASNEIENILVNAAVYGKKYFTVVERYNIDRVLDELQFQSTGLIDDNSAAKIGRVLGIAGIYLGRADVSSSEDYFYESRTKCVSRNKKGKCERYENFRVNCTKRSITVNVLPKLIDVQTAQVVYSGKMTRSDSSEKCDDSSLPLHSISQMADGALDDILQSFRKDIAPYVETVNIVMMDTKDGIGDASGKELLKNSILFAKKGRMDRACEMWKKGAETYAGSISFAYNLGVCFEAEGKLTEALNKYKQADRMTMKPMDDINKALFRINKRIIEREKLKRQLR